MPQEVGDSRLATPSQKPSRVAVRQQISVPFCGNRTEYRKQSAILADPAARLNAALYQRVISDVPRRDVQMAAFVFVSGEPRTGSTN